MYLWGWPALSTTLLPAQPGPPNKTRHCPARLSLKLNIFNLCEQAQASKVTTSRLVVV